MSPLPIHREDTMSIHPISFLRRKLSSFFSELGWTFTWPMAWLQGVIFNLLLACAYLLFQSPQFTGHYDTVLLYCVYFSTFILADVTTSNIFGPDVARTTQFLQDGQSFLRILFRKNAVQFVVILLPMLIITAAWTEYLYNDSELLRTIPGVLYPMLLFMALGNLISVLFPVIQAPLTWHIMHWHQWRYQVPLLTSYAIPFIIFALWVYTDLPGYLFGMLLDAGSDNFVPQGEISTVLLAASYGIYLLMTLLSAAIFRKRGFVFLAQDSLIADGPFDEETREAMAHWHPRKAR